MEKTAKVFFYLVIIGLLSYGIHQQGKIINNQHLNMRQLYLSEHPAVHPKKGAKFIGLLKTAKVTDYDNLSPQDRVNIGMVIFRLEETYKMRHIWSQEEWSLLEKDARMVWQTPLVIEHWKRGGKDWHSKEFRNYVNQFISKP